MSLPTCREVRTQLLIVVGFATAALSATTFFLESQKPVATAPEIAALRDTQVNWDDVNLVTGGVESPETIVKTERSKMLRDFEAR